MKIVLLIWMALSGCLARGSELPDYPFIHASGNAKIFVQPDIGEVSFEVVVADVDPEKATAAVQSVNDDILKLLAEQNIPASDITIYQLEKKQLPIDPNGAAPGAVQYEIKQGMQIEVRDMNKWENLTTPLLSKEHLGNFYTNFDRTDRQQIKDGLMVEAVKDAQHNGGLMAESFGKHLGAVVAISSDKLRNLGYTFGTTKGDVYDNSDRAAQSVRKFSAPQPLVIMQSVDAIFRMK